MMLIKRFAALLLSLLLVMTAAAAEEWLLEDQELRGARLDYRACPLSDELIQVEIVLRSAGGELPDAFSLYADGVCAGIAEPTDSGFFGYAEAPYAQSLAVVPIYHGAESALEAVILAPAEPDYPTRWEAYARTCGCYSVSAAALELDDGIINVQAVHSLLRETDDPLTAWHVYFDGRFVLTLQPYRLPGDPEVPVRYYGTAVTDVPVTSVVIIPVLEKSGEQIRLAITLDGSMAQ